MTWHKIAKLFEAIEMRLIASLKRNLAPHKEWERTEGFDWPAWQADKISRIEEFRRENNMIVAEYQPIIDADTRILLEEQEQEGAQFTRDEYTALTGRDPHNTAFSGINRPRMERLLEDVTGAEERAQTSALRMTDDVYRRTLYQADIAVAAGAMTPQQAIDMATRDFLTAGINSIEYRDGRHVNIASYAEMALRTNATRSFLQGAAKQRQALGIDTVLVSQYGACSKTCLPWQGKVYIDDVYADFAGIRAGDRGQSNNGLWYPLLSAAIRGGLFHPNCRHTVTTWIEGISTLPPPMDAGKIREIAKLEERQRELERKVRKYKRLKTGSMSPDSAIQYGRKLGAAQQELREFISEHNDVLRRDYWRERNPYGSAKPLKNGRN